MAKKSDVIRVGLIDQDTLVHFALEKLLLRVSDIELSDHWLQMPVTPDLSTQPLDLLIASIETLMIAGGSFASLARLAHQIPVLTTSIYLEPSLVVNCLQSGAKGFVWKGAEPQLLLEAIKAVALGQQPLLPPMAEDLIDYIINKDIGCPLRGEALTKREKEVLRLIAQGMSNKEIGEVLKVSVRTVKAHVSNILRKLDVADRTQAALVAVSAESTKTTGIFRSELGTKGR